MIKVRSLLLAISYNTIHRSVIDENGKEPPPRDYHKALHFYTLACDGNHAEGCQSAGIMYYYARGVPTDTKKAKELFGKACDGGVTDGCSNYAILEKKGI